MRALKLGAALALATWLAGSFAQQGTPPPETPPPATRQPPNPRPPPAEPAAPAPEQGERQAPPADEEAADVFVPTEELQPDAAVTFPVDI